MQDWLAHRARATPGREALVNAASGNAWSYATLDETVEEMAGRLHALGVEPEDHAAAVLGTGVEAVCLVHAAMRLGATLAPLSPEFTPPELRARIDRADADTVVCDGSTEETVKEAVQTAEPEFSVLTIDEADWEGATPLSSAEAAPFTPAEWGREDVQLLLFTSGTTGEAKAVQLTMGNLLASAAASAFRLGIDPDDRWLVPLSLHHMGGIAPFLRSTLYGTTAVIRPSFDPGGTVDDLRNYDATCVSLVPTMLRRMLSARGTLPDSLRFVLVGGAPCPEELIDRCRDYSVPVCPTYGMTETASQVATARHREAYEHPATVGRPLIWTDVTVVDETGSPVEAGETGELVVSGPTLTPGYYDDHAATGEAMGSHGFHTGDVGYQDELGRLYVLNRLDDRILTGGENVNPGEVVDALQAHEAISEAAVVGLPDEQWGEQVAALLVAEDEPPEIEALESFLRARLAGFKLPRTIGFTAELPRTVSGTIEREAVKERLLEGESVHIGHPVSSARASANEQAPGDEGLLEPDAEGETAGAGETAEVEGAGEATEAADPRETVGVPEADETEEPEVATQTEEATETAAASDVEPEAEPAVEERQTAEPTEATAGEPTESGAEEPTDTARSNLDDAELGSDERSATRDESDPDETDGREALREAADEESVEARTIDTGEAAESTDEAIRDLDTAATEESDPEPLRKGGSVLSDDLEGSSVTAEPGAALGTGRSDDGAEADIDAEGDDSAAGDDSDDNAADEDPEESRDDGGDGDDPTEDA